MKLFCFLEHVEHSKICSKDNEVYGSSFLMKSPPTKKGGIKCSTYAERLKNGNENKCCET